MEKILLAIDGNALDSKMLNFAVTLCKRMRAGLEVLLIPGLLSCKRHIRKVTQSARHAQRAFEDAMVAATFAEAGQHDAAGQLQKQAFENLNRLIPEAEKGGIDYHLTLKSGRADEEIVRYVADHRDVILTIYASSAAPDMQRQAKAKKENAVRKIGQKLSTPLVVMRER